MTFETLDPAKIQLLSGKEVQEHGTKAQEETGDRGAANCSTLHHCHHNDSAFSGNVPFQSC